MVLPKYLPIRDIERGVKLKKVGKAVKPTELILGVNELVRALVRAHAERFTGETVTISKVEYERTHKLASAAVDFSEATMERVCKAMDQLEEARSLGHAALEPMQSKH